MEKNEPLVKMVNINKWFESIHALKDIDLEVKHREILGLVGDNGAGKSTLIKILSGYYRPDGGEMWIEGKKVQFSSPAEARKLGIETLYQDHALAPHLTAARNVFLGREVTRFSGFVDYRSVREKSAVALERVGLYLKSVDLPINVLSGGERQGVALARAMYFGAKLVILDEPTASLSIKESKKVLEFATTVREKGLSLIFVTHNLYHVYPIADKFIVLSRGEKLADIAKGATSVEELSRLIAS